MPGSMNAAADRNLLLGILALQTGLISRDALLAAVEAWLQDREVPLEEHLVERGALAAEHRVLLVPLVEALIRHHGGDPRQSLEVLHVGLQIADCGLKTESAIRNLQSAISAIDSPVRYRILRPHAEGGLGQVFLARDEEVGRDVALKEIKPRWANHAGSRARFTREAEITGGLEHPGIVPVYGLGAYADGRPFYAMRFIRGSSLQEAIEAFHESAAAKNPLTSPARNLELRRLLTRLIDVCEAIDYAHSRGVLHRDLKPGNIMLGRYGETLVVDWGLAKPLAKSPADPADDDAAGKDLPLVPAGDGEPTRLGSAIGTPGYMSPEQAAGRLTELGPASDVFSLGATLYHLLVGAPPYVAGDLLRQAQEADYPRPGAIRPDVPRPLEAVCLKAMEPRPEDRYMSARELADEIERWLAGEPVTAYPERPHERAARWARKNRAWVTAGGLALTLITAVSTVAFLIVGFQNWEIANLAEAEKDARQTAETKRREAETARDDEARARKDVEIARQQARADRRRLAEIIDQIGQDVYRNRRHRPLLESGITNYRDFLHLDEDADGDNPLLRARFQAKLATLLESLDDYAGAKAAYTASIAQYESLLAEDATVNARELQSELGTAYGNLGAMYVQTPETLAALSALGKAIGIQRKLVDATSATKTDRRELARHHYNRGYIRSHHGLSGALDDLHAAVQLQQVLAAEEPQSDALALELGVMEIELGLLQAAAARQVLAAGMLDVARRQSADQELRAARDLVHSGVTKLENLVSGNSGNSEYRKELADGYAELAQAQALAGELTTAEESLAKSIDGFSRLLSDFPADPDFRRGLALARFHLGLVKENAGDVAIAEESYRACAEIQERLTLDYPQRALYWTDAAKTWTNLSALLLKEKNPSAAMAAAKTAIVKIRQAWKLSRFDEQLRPMVYQAYVELARIAIRGGDHAELAELGQSHAALRPDSQQDLFDAAKLTAVAAALAASDRKLTADARKEAEGAYAQAAIDFLRSAIEHGFRNVQTLRTEPDLAALRSRPDFQELLGKLAESSKFKVQNSRSEPGNLEP
ncbi:MAG TPA: serine/threonine-protein kinase [Pirellulaceae bacterium]|nr:serine/threonine-protein kinase [Pirellulaceae bacterium]